MATSRRSPRAAFFHLFDDSATPVYALDANRRLIYCNSALADWLDSNVDDLVGTIHDFGSGTANSQERANDAVHGLGVPPTVFEGDSTRGTVVRRAKSGASEIRSAFFGSLLDEKENPMGVVAIVGSVVSDETGGIGVAALHHQIMHFRERYRSEYALERLIGNSSAIQLVRDRVDLATKSPTRVVITGPKGSGREHVARTIHYQTRDDRLPPLVPLDCALLDAELLQTTVTAFLQQCAELQIGGIPCLLLLDVDQLSSDAQDVLHKFLSIAEFELRTVATTCEPLSDVASFRDDIAAMLSTLTIRLPSLSERLEDIPILLQHAIETINSEGGKQVAGFSEQATRQLIQYPWPGNVDELLRMAREIHQAAPNAVVAAEDLPKQIRLGIDADEFPILEPETVQLDEFLESTERELVSRALKQAGGNKSQAARLLGINRARLLRRLNHLGIES